MTVMLNNYRFFQSRGYTFSEASMSGGAASMIAYSSSYSYREGQATRQPEFPDALDWIDDPADGNNLSFSDLIYRSSRSFSASFHQNTSWDAANHDAF